MTRWILVLVPALALTGCMRGCSGLSTPAPTCDDSSDCKSGTCHRGYCVDEAYVRADDQCRASAACTESGDCTAVLESSFLGLFSGFDCGADDDEDCRSSRRCATHGACALPSETSVHCGATSALHCLLSERCATHEECSIDGHECVRDWSACPVLACPAAPVWADPVELVWDYDSLREPWQPGDQASATIACRIEGGKHSGSTLRIAGRCAPGPELDRHGHGEVLRAGVALHPGAAIAVAVQDGPIGRSRDGSFVELHYDGASPMRAGRDGESIECVVVPPAVQLARATRELAAVDRELANAARERPDLANPRAMGGAVEVARIHAGRAALWLGWRDPPLAPRVAKLDVATASWLARLDIAIHRLPATPAPIRSTHAALTPTGRICGAALRALTGSADAACALELAIDNTSNAAIALWPQSGQLDEIAQLTWLRPAHDGEAATVIPAPLVAIGAGTGSIELQPGQRALVLVTGLQDHAVLHGRIGFAAPFDLRP